MHCTSFVLGDERINGLLDTVMQEDVDVILAKDESRANAVFERLVNVDFRQTIDGAKQLGACLVPQAGEPTQSLSRLRRKTIQLPYEKIDYIIGKMFRPEAVEVPTPRPQSLVDRKQPLVGQCRDK